MKNPIPFVQIKPIPARHTLKAVYRRRLIRARPAPAVKCGAWPADLKRAFLAALSHHEGVAAAARAVGRTASSALTERSRDPVFALAWDNVLDPRLEQLETLLLDRTIARLGPAFVTTGLSEAALRHDASVGMWFLEARMPQRYGKGRVAAPPPAAVTAAAAARTAVDPAAERLRIAELIAAAEKRIIEAEICLRGGTTD